MAKMQKKPKFRAMHHRLHDEPEWHIDDPLDELDSMISENFKDHIKKTFKAEFSGAGSKRVSNDDEEVYRPNIFHGNFSQYKAKH